MIAGLLIPNILYMMLASSAVMLVKIALNIAFPESRKPGFELKPLESHRSTQIFVDFIRAFRIVGAIIGTVNLYIFIVDVFIYPLPGGFNLADIFRHILILYFGLEFIIEPIKSPTKYDLLEWSVIMISAVLTYLYLASTLGKMAIIFLGFIIIPWLIFGLMQRIFRIFDEEHKLWNFSVKFDMIFNFYLNMVMFILISIEWVIDFWGLSIMSIF
ncbi:MAG: hypothetical protein ACTSU2_06570 [Promethearchaeota archaeon]